MGRGLRGRGFGREGDHRFGRRVRYTNNGGVAFLAHLVDGFREHTPRPHPAPKAYFGLFFFSRRGVQPMIVYVEAAPADAGGRVIVGDVVGVAITTKGTCTIVAETTDGHRGRGGARTRGGLGRLKCKQT